MKQLLQSCLLLLLGAPLFAQKTIHVKANAAGANNGTSWQDAYTKLSDALAVSAEGDQIWVAAGTYKPDPIVAKASFQLQVAAALYGGFAGTETALSARNIAANPTILSGDLTGDDVVGNFTTKRTDNSTHVLEVSDPLGANKKAIVDGFTVSGGQTLAGSTNPDLSRRGGGILVTGPLTVRNCRFTDNNADTGGGLAALGAAASGLLVDNCVFEKNNCVTFGAGMVLRDLSNGAEVNRCTFANNTTIRGSFYVITSANLVMDSCQFLNNFAATTPCSGMYTWQTTFTLTNSLFKGNRSVDYSAMYNDGRGGVYPFTIDRCRFEGNIAVDSVASNNVATGGAIFNATTTSTIKNCEFINNSGHLGGGVYLSGTIKGYKNILENCTFEGNRAAPGLSTSASRGGAFYSSKATYEVHNCVFKGSRAGTSGGHVHNADSSLYLFKSCRFEGGQATFGGGASNYNPGAVGSYESCTFTGNTAATSGGAMTNGFTANNTLISCVLESNNARNGAGLFVQNNNTKLTIQKSDISGNAADANGGALAVSVAGAQVLIEESNIVGNSANTGGGLYFTDDTLNLGTLTARNSIIQNNIANVQGAGAYISDVNTDFTNCLFFSNSNLGTGAGGAIINNASGATSPLTLTNCIISENTSTIGGGIAQWQDSSGVATLSLQNCILYNNTPTDYEIEDGKPTVQSKGGNLCGDGTLNAELTQQNDLIGLDPKFADPGAFDYHLTAGSPCIDKGVVAGAPTTDLEGKPRVGLPDQGCYEFQSVGTRDPRSVALPLRLFPNPATTQTVLTVDGVWAGEAQISVYDQQGALAQHFAVQKAPGLLTQTLDLSGLPQGTYSVRLVAGTRRYEGKLVKGE